MSTEKTKAAPEGEAVGVNAVPEGPQAPLSERWISVDDARKPDYNKRTGYGDRVLVWPDQAEQYMGGYGVAWYGTRGSDEPGFYRHGAPVRDVTHWMPYPEVPNV